MRESHLLCSTVACGVFVMFSLAVQAAGSDKYDLKFDLPRHGYLTVDNSTIMPSEIVSKNKFFEDSSQNAFTIMDTSADFTTETQLRDVVAKKARQVKEQGYEAKWEKKGPYQVFCVARASRDRYIYEYMFATGQHGYGVAIITPDKDGLVLELGPDTLRIVDNVQRPPLSHKLSAFKCDICLTTQKEGGYVIDHETVVGSDTYIDWYIDLHKKRGNLPRDAVVTDQMKRLIRSSLDQTAGSTPWFVCHECMIEIFPNLLKDRERTMHYRLMAEKFWAKIKVSNEMAKYNGVALAKDDARGGAQPSDETLTLDLGNGVTMELVLVPAGAFMMGSPSSEEGRKDDEGPQHRHRITQPFYMGKYEVTQSQWQAVMGNNPSHFTFKGSGDLPVVVSWDDCQEFCKKLSRKTGHKIRLPGEAEWEYACRAGTTTRFSSGDGDDALGNHAWYYRNSDPKPHPVGGKKPNAWGLYDMHGNVWEWCEDWYDKDAYQRYRGGDLSAPKSGTSRVLRGGSWMGNGTDYFRCAYRFSGEPGDRLVNSGFRVARTLTP